MAPSARPVPRRVLILADQPLVVELISLTLNHGAFVARDVRSIPDANQLVAEWRPDIAVIDMDLGGADLLHQLRQPQANRSVPVLALTRRGDLKTKLQAFNQGVDDVLTVPFSPEELLARVIVITRRSYGRVSTLLTTLKFGELELDILNRQVRAGNSVLHLTGLELSLLYLLAANAGRVVQREEILDALWGTDFLAESNIVDRHVRSLRAKLQNDWHAPRYIETVPGQGYRFIPTSANQGQAGALAPVRRARRQDTARHAVR